MPQPWPAAGPAGQGRRGWQETRLRYKGTAKNTLAEPDPLKRLAPAGNGIVFQRALSGIVRGKTVSLMLLPTGQMVSEPRSRAAFVRGARSGGREGSCFHAPVICRPWGWEQRAVASSLCRTAPQQGHRHPGNRAQFSPCHCSSWTSELLCNRALV